MKAREVSGLLEETTVASASLGVPGGPGGPLAETALSLLLHEGAPQDVVPIVETPRVPQSEQPAAEGGPTVTSGKGTGGPPARVVGRLLVGAELIPKGGPLGGPPSWAAAVCELPPGVFLCRWGAPHTQEGPPGQEDEDWVPWETLRASIR